MQIELMATDKHTVCYARVEYHNDGRTPTLHGWKRAEFDRPRST